MRDDPARRIAMQLERRGLGAPARLLLDAHLPLGPVVADAGAALGPLLRAFGGPAADDLPVLLDDERAIERVIAELDALEARRAEPG